MRVHGYMSNTEPWRYGAEAQDIIKKCIERRKALFPYIYSNAAEISFNGSTLMRPLVFDFGNDAKALAQNYEFMFGKSLLVSPVTEPNVTTWKTYLPENKAGWYSVTEDYKYYDGGQIVETQIDDADIPTFAKGGSIVVRKISEELREIEIFAGDNAKFVLYEDDGESFDFENGNYARTLITWDEKSQRLIIAPDCGNNKAIHKFRLLLCNSNGVTEKNIDYKGKTVKIKL